MKKSDKHIVLFDEENIVNVGYINNFIFACEVKGRTNIRLSNARRPAYHLVMIILNGSLKIIANGKEFLFKKNSYVNLPIVLDIYSIETGPDFHAMLTATDHTVMEDIFHNRTPIPPNIKFKLDHALGGEILSDSDIRVLKKDIVQLLEALSDRSHNFAHELGYAYFYIMLTDMSNIMWKRYGGKKQPSHNVDLRHAEQIMKDFIALLMEHAAEETRVDFYAGKLCISKQYLAFIVKEKTHVTIGTLMDSVRIEMATKMLRDPNLTIGQIATKLSYSDQSSFGKFFKRVTGTTPLQYRRNIMRTLLTMRSSQ